MRNFLKMILSWFKKDAPKKIDVIKIEPMPEKDISSSKKGLKIAILVGHSATDSGATCWNKMTEHDYNKYVASLLKSDKHEIKVYFKTSAGWGPTYVKMGLFRPDLSIELHLNAYNGKAVGGEVLCLKGDHEASAYGRKFIDKFCHDFQRRQRNDKGIKWIERGDRGHGNLAGASKVAKAAILLEPFFCDTRSEWIEPDIYAEWLNNFIKDL